MAKNLFKGMAALCFCAAFASCSHDAGFETPNQFELKKNQYSANFIKLYGEIDPNQSWDFTNPSNATTRAIESGQKQEGANFYSICSIDDQAMHELISGSSSSYNVTVDGINYQVKASAQDIDFNPFFQAKLTPCFARIDKFNTTTYHYYHLAFKWGNNQSMEMIANIKVVGRNTGDYWYDGKGSGSVIHRTSRLVNTLDGVGSGNWYAYYTVNSGSGTAHNNTTAVSKVREFVVDDGKNPVRTYWGFDCDGADNKKVDLICLVRDYKTPDPKIKRYMSEDLGTTDDFDFNDIVVDIEDDQLGHQTATIRAMGGTLDFTLNVAGKPVWTKSVDGVAKGYAVINMENTTSPDYTKVIDQFEISGWIPDQNNISVTVTYKDNTSETGNTIYDIPFPKVGQVPMMFATDPIVSWMIEKKNFPKWWLEQQGRDEDFMED